MNLRLVKQGNFLGIKCDFYEDKHGEVYMTRKQIGEALQYKTPEDAIYRIHERNKDRLDKLSVTVKLSSTDSKHYDTFVYKAKGIFDIIRYSRQPIADEFMDWVYDVIEAIRTGRISHDVLRQAGIVDRRNMTDSIRDNIEESPNKRFQYRNFTDLVYKHLFGMTAKRLREELLLDKTEELRDLLDDEQLKSVQRLERNISSMIEQGMAYKEIKEVLERKPIIRSLPRKRDRIAAERAN
ncbi:hypothetical protein DMN77_23195 [Paenibacillus sp. 79R4]|uniref:BRO family protein n=1 Tax=Paenibacillus sp. 79R4 TaxID=2212847 RepID=UPI0015B959CB|nr:BRO family protein [Paenibacillus sp. 79R4]NWL90461.1 hypothetical protein [Paenibacillus sp. 79R4]